MSYDNGGGRAASGAAARPHDLKLEGRRKLSLSGVEEVESFDEREIVLRCGGGLLVVGGEELSVKGLNVESGDVTVLGRVDSLVYEDSAPRRGGLWQRLGRG